MISWRPIRPRAARTSAARTTPSWSSCCCARLGDRRRAAEKKHPRFRPPSSTRRSSRTPKGDRVFRRCSSSTTRGSGRPRSNPSGSTSGSPLGRSEGRLRQEGGAGDHAGPQKKQMLFVLGQVYDRELGERKASRDLHRDHRHRSRGLEAVAGARSRCPESDRALVRLLLGLEGRRAVAVAGQRWCRCVSASASCGGRS